MKKLLSVWLVPQEEDKKYLQEVVNKLAKENSSPVFVPHLTILGDTIIELEDLKTVIDKTFKNVKPFEIKKTKISQSELFFKTVFIEFEMSDILRNLSENLISNLPLKSDYTFKPHISLMYKEMLEEKKVKIVNEINIKEKYIIDTVIINTPTEGDKDYLDIAGWHSSYTLKLDD